jgi:effector-binding domain-containing protein
MTTEQIPIGTFSRVTRLSPRALRLYDERGLLVPSGKDLCTGYRYYTFEQIGRGVHIRHLTWLGFSLQEVGMLLEARDAGDRVTIRDLFGARRERVGDELRRLAAIDAALSNEEPELEVFCMSITEPVIKEVPPQRVLSRRARGTYETTIPLMIAEICGALAPDRQNPIRVAGPLMTIYHDNEHKEQDADMEVAIPVTGRIVLDSSSLELRNLSGGRVVSVIYTGPYPGIGKAHEKVYGYLQSQGLSWSGPPRELYLNDPNDIPEAELMTEVQYPVD